MTKQLLKFITIALLLTVALIPFNYFIYEEMLKVPFDYAMYLTYAYFLIVTIVIQRSLLKSISDRPQKFVINFMAAMGGKIFLSLILLLTHMYFNKVGGKIYAVNFTILYLMYSFVGSYYILKIQRQEKS